MSEIQGYEGLTPEDLGYDPETLEPVLKFDERVVARYPDVFEGMKALGRYKNYKLLSPKEMRAEVERQYDLIKQGVDPNAEHKARLTLDGRFIDKNNLLAWKLEAMPTESIPESLRPFVRCPIYYSIDDRSDEIKEKLIQRDINRQKWSLGEHIVDEDYQQTIRDEYYNSAPGYFYEPYLDIIIMPNWEQNNYYKTTLAHEVGHSILHQISISREQEDRQERSDRHEVEADQFVYDHFKNEPWFDARVLHNIQIEGN